MRKLLLSLAALLPVALVSADAAENAPHPPNRDWSFEGFFGTFDRASLQRGFQVYREVCANCHSLQHVYYRNLEDLGFDEDEVKAIAAAYQVTDGPNDSGEMFQRPGRPSDRFVLPFANEKAARAANNGAYPPDLSLMTKAREGGADYLHALLVGYREPPSGVQLQEGMHYNAFFPGFQIAMPPPLNPNGVTYADNTEASVEQMASDVTSFLAWAAEPELEQRKRTGAKVVLFLIVMTALFFLVKRKIWADLH